MTDTGSTDEEPLRYMGGTTRHDGPGDEPQKMGSASLDDLAIDDLQPGVGSASTNTSPPNENENESTDGANDETAR